MVNSFTMLLTVIFFSNVILFHSTAEEQTILSSIILKKGIGIKEYKENNYSPLLEREKANVAKGGHRRSGKEDAQKVNRFFGNTKQAFVQADKETQTSKFILILGKKDGENHKEYSPGLHNKYEHDGYKGYKKLTRSSEEVHKKSDQFIDKAKHAILKGWNKVKDTIKYGGRVANGVANRVANRVRRSIRIKPHKGEGKEALKFFKETKAAIVQGWNKFKHFFSPWD